MLKFLKFHDEFDKIQATKAWSMQVYIETDNLVCETVAISQDWSSLVYFLIVTDKNFTDLHTVLH